MRRRVHERVRLVTRPNVELLRRTLEHIEATPLQWDQNTWAEDNYPCGTTYCFAGWAVVLSGAAFAQETDRIMSGRVVPPGRSPFDRAEWRDVAEYAAGILGLPAPEAPVKETGQISGDIPALFDACNELDDLRRIVGELCEQAGGE